MEISLDQGSWFSAVHSGTASPQEPENTAKIQ